MQKLTIQVLSRQENLLQSTAYRCIKCMPKLQIPVRTCVLKAALISDDNLLKNTTFSLTLLWPLNMAKVNGNEGTGKTSKYMLALPYCQVQHWYLYGPINIQTFASRPSRQLNILQAYTDSHFFACESKRVGEKETWSNSAVDRFGQQSRDLHKTKTKCLLVLIEYGSPKVFLFCLVVC